MRLCGEKDKMKATHTKNQEQVTHVPDISYIFR